MADERTYTTTLHDHGWWCNCPGAFNGNADEVMPPLRMSARVPSMSTSTTSGAPSGASTRDAVNEVDNHVGYYGDTWSHTVVDNTTDQVWPDRVAEEWCAESAAQERAELLALTADEDLDDDVDGS